MQVKQREAVEFIETHPRFFLKSVSGPLLGHLERVTG